MGRDLLKVQDAACGVNNGDIGGLMMMCGDGDDDDDIS